MRVRGPEVIRDMCNGLLLSPRLALFHVVAFPTGNRSIVRCSRSSHTKHLACVVAPRAVNWQWPRLGLYPKHPKQQVSIQNCDGEAPSRVRACMQASWHGREASVAAFLDAGVDPAALNRLGQTPLYFAQQNEHDGCAMLLRGNTPPPLRRLGFGLY